ncbi:MAG: HAMP domain-containing histidine kinase [Propionibacteriaceae bacterium]|nr:HAMP domain-containing histidine kinase [Propionibacteriaceae bacterium]
MKLWHKIFLLTFALFVVAFDLGVYLLSSLSFRSAIDTARSQAVAEYGFVARSLSTDLDSLVARGGDTPDALTSLMLSYTSYYQARGVRLELLRDGVVGGSLPDGVLTTTPGPQPVSTVVSAEGQRWMLVDAQLPGGLSAYSLAYASDVTSLYDEQSALANRLFLIAAAITVAFSIALYLILRRLTKPITIIQETADKVAAGDYAARAGITSRDDIGTLASRFDAMTEQVASHIDEAEQQVRNQRQFIDNMAHEMRTPLTSIFGNAELLRQARLTNDQRADASERIMSGVQRLQALSQKLLSLALARQSAIDWQNVPLGDLIDQVFELEGPAAATAGVRLAALYGHTSVRGDSLLLQTMLANLVDNALKASLPGGLVEVEVTTSENTATISVKDHGRGVPPEQVRQVFQPFYRTDEARSSAQGGTGLGLALCQQIADAHGASIAMTSEPGKGTTVTVSGLSVAGASETITGPTPLGDNSTTSGE